MTFYTTPSRWVGLYNGQNWYPRVVRIDDVSGQSTEWAAQSMLDIHSGYERHETKQITIPVTPEFSTLVQGFFGQYLTEPINPFGGNTYNCHRFARHISDIEASEPLDDPDDIIADGRLLGAQENLSLGQHGVVGATLYPEEYRLSRPFAPHSIVGLGELTNECLEIVSLFGYMALTTYKDTLSFDQCKYS